MPNQAGIEYIKTKTSLCKSSHRLIDIIYGGGMLIQQNFESNDLGIIYTSTLKKGSKAVVFSGYDYVISNTKSSPLIFMEIFLKN